MFNCNVSPLIVYLIVNPSGNTFGIVYKTSLSVNHFTGPKPPPNNIAVPSLLNSHSSSSSTCSQLTEIICQAPIIADVPPSCFIYANLSPLSFFKSSLAPVN